MMLLARRFAAAVALLACIALPSPVAAQAITAEALGPFLSELTCVAAPPGDFDRIFVGQKRGVVHALSLPDGALLGTFLALPDVSSDGEGGLLGIAFHPDYLTNGRLYVSYTTGELGDSVLAEFCVADPLANEADAECTGIVFGPVPQVSITHKGGSLAFDSSGLLYWSLGDGGCCNDWLENAQNLQSPRGKILRFDVDVPFPHVPASNPFVGDANALDVIYAYGVRNPWRIGIDPLTDDLYVGDVGESTFEEISWIPGDSGGGQNLGWRCKEGTHCTGLSGCLCVDTSLTDPIHEYGPEGCAIVAGPVYRGAAIPELYGRAVYTDFCSNVFFSYVNDGGVTSDFVDHAPMLPEAVGAIASFGADAAGELYFVTLWSGTLYRVVPAEVCEAERFCSPASPNGTGEPARIQVGGTTSVTANDLFFKVAPVEGTSTGLVAYSPDEAELPLGNGTLCLGTQTLGWVLRLPPAVTAGTSLRHVLDVESPPHPSGQIDAGSTWNFQAWYRDFTPGGSGFNFSDALRVTFCP